MTGPAPARFRARHPELGDHPTPWLGRVGLAVATVVLVLGGAATFAIGWAMSPAHYLAHPAQLIGAALLAAIAIAGGLLIRPGTVRPVRPWLPAAVTALVLASAYQLLRYYLQDHVDAWVTTGVMVVLIALAILLAAVLRLDVTGLAVGAALTYAWVGMRAAAGAGIAGIVEQCVIVGIVLVVIVLAVTRRGRRPAPAPDQNPDLQNRRSSAESMPRSAS